MCPALGASLVAAALRVASAQEPGVALSPFITLVPAGGGPMTGLSIGVGGGALAVRAGGQLSLQAHSVAATSTAIVRPWAADADALAYLESYDWGSWIHFTPYVFTGVSTTAVDSQ